jgi:shikimate kinase
VLHAAAQAAPLAPGWRRRPIVLVGLMGSGKTTVGKRLAARLHWPFVDADSEIEAAAQMPISEIFARFGEPHFRDGERRVIARLMEGTPDRSRPRVIATGGGAFVDPQTRALILEKGTAVWLDAPIDTLVARVSRRSHRPLLVGRDPRQVLTELLELRRPDYAEAPLRIVSADGPHEQTVEAILAELARRDPACAS